MDGRFQHLSEVMRAEPRPDMHFRAWPSHRNRVAPWRRHLDGAWAAARQLDPEVFFDNLEAIERAVEADAMEHEGPWRDEIGVLKAISHVWRDNAPSAATFAATIARGPSRHRSVARAVLCYAAWQQHDLTQFHRLARFSRCHLRGPLALLNVFQSSMQAAAEAEQLRFKHAERLAKAALRVPLGSDAAGPQCLLPGAVLAAIAYETGDIDEADQLIHGRMALVERAGGAESASLVCVVSARLALERDNVNVALLLLAQGEKLALQRGWLRLALRCASERIRIHLLRGDLEAARGADAGMDRLIQTSSLRLTDPAFDIWPLEAARCRLLMASGHPDVAAASASALRNVARSRGQAWVAVRLTVLLAGALMAAGDWATGLAELAGGLEEGASAGLYRTFVDELGLIAKGLRRLRRDPRVYRGHLGAYLDGLLAYEKPLPTLARRKKLGRPGQIEPLTEREIVVLRLMSLGLSNKEIARALDIMPETIKSHAKRIFVKLAAKARTEAVYRASELGLM